VKLKGRMVATILIPVSVIFLVAASFVGVDVYNTAKRDALLLSEATARDYAGEIEAELEKSLESARSVARAAEGLINQGSPDRENLKAIMRNIIEHNEKLFGLWVCFEPNAFEGRDKEYIGTKGHDETGRFIPYFHRKGENIEIEALKGYALEGEGDY
jgi:methyl-accepting chemotaxis protein